jgi:hypothetical protein
MRLGAKEKRKPESGNLKLAGNGGWKHCSNSGDFRRFPEISNQFQSIPITFGKIMSHQHRILDMRHDDLPKAWWRGDRGDGPTSKCPLRGQTMSQRDIVHHPSGCKLRPFNWQAFRRFPEISNQFQSLLEKIETGSGGRKKLKDTG